MQESVNNLIAIVCETVSEFLGKPVSPETLFAIREKNVARTTSTARQIVHYALHCVKGYSVTYTANVTGTTRRSVFLNVKKAKNFLQIDKTYRELFFKVKERIT